MVRSLACTLWDIVVSNNTSEGSLCSGLGDDLAAIMRIVEPLLVKRVGFAVRIVEVVPRMSVLHLGAVHVPTGREWLGRRDVHGGVLLGEPGTAPSTPVPSTTWRRATTRAPSPD